MSLQPVYKFLLTSIDQIDLTPVFPIIFKETDAGPGVGVSNIKVRYRDVELARMQNSCLVIRAHHAPYDSGMNGAERSNAAIDDAIVDGGVVDWQHFMPFDSLTEDEIVSLTTEDVEILKQNANKKNYWRVAHELRNRTEDEPGPAGDYIKAYVTLPESDQFFFNGSYLKEYVSATSISKKHSVLGHDYFSKMDSFIQSHVILGEMHLESRKGRCLDKRRSCEFCLTNDDVLDTIKSVPQPLPNYEEPPHSHYLPVNQTSLQLEDGSDRNEDDFYPRVQVRRLFELGMLKLDDRNSIKEFSMKYIVPEPLVPEPHLCELKSSRDRKKQEHINNNDKEDRLQFSDFDCKELLDTGKLKKKRKVVLEKYIKHHNLSVTANEKNILYNTVAAHILQSATAVERDLRGQVDYDSNSTTSGSETEEIEETSDSEQVIDEISGQ